MPGSGSVLEDCTFLLFPRNLRAVRMEIAARMSIMPKVSQVSGRSPSSMREAVIPITGTARVPIPATPAGSLFMTKVQRKKGKGANQHGVVEQGHDQVRCPLHGRLRYEKRGHHQGYGSINELPCRQRYEIEIRSFLHHLDDDGAERPEHSRDDREDFTERACFSVTRAPAAGPCRQRP